MSKELVINTSARETRLAILEDDQLVEIHVEQESQHALAGSIYKGRVTRVLPGMQSAFVDIGLERDAFLYVSDFFEENKDEFDRISPAEADEGSNVPESSSDRQEASGEESDREQRKTRGGRRDRRRSRRRRQRDSGFPSQKFAGAPKTDTPSPKSEPRKDDETEAAEGPRPEPEFTVLPGESLAKYESTESQSHSDSPAGTGAAGTSGPPAEEEDRNRSEPEVERGSTDSPVTTKTTSDLSDAQRLERKEPESPGAPSLQETSSKRETSPAQGSQAGEDANPAPSKFTGKAATSESGTGDDTSSIASRSSSGPGLPRGNDPNPAEAESMEGNTASSTETGTEGVRSDPPAVSVEESSADPLQGTIDSEDTAAAADHVSEKTAEDQKSADDQQDRRRVRLRGDSGPSRYVRRRGRRGRRRPRKKREAPETESPAESSAEPLPEPASQDESARKISDLLAKGKEILVQIAKEPLGKKGARITSHIALPGRFLVYMPTVEHVGVSRKIASDKERSRLRKIVQTHCTGMPGGFIVRTAAEEIEEEDIRGDMLFLYNLWLDIKEKSERNPSPSLIHHDDDVVERVLRDRVGEEFKTIWVDSEEEYERILRFAERFQPDLLGSIKLYTRPQPVFDAFNITNELEKALRPKVWLKSGGYVVINPTEALVAIDVNTGKYVGKSDRLEDTIVNTNLEAAKEIARQLRIRDLGGIIVVDFIDMEDRSNRQQVLATLEKELRKDIAPSKVLSFNEFGLVAITRKRTKQSLERSLCTGCPYCHGAGYVKSIKTVIYDILVEAKKMSSTMEPKKDITLRVNKEVARRLKSKDNNYLQEIEQTLHAQVLVRSDASLHREHFDIH